MEKGFLSLIDYYSNPIHEMNNSILNDLYSIMMISILATADRVRDAHSSIAFVMVYNLLSPRCYTVHV